MTTIEIEGFDPDEPIGTALNDARDGERVKIALNDNGMALLFGKATRPTSAPPLDPTFEDFMRGWSGL